MSLIVNAKDVPVASVVDFTEVDDLDISDMQGVTTGLKPLDKELIKIFYGTLSVLSGRPASGKTSLIDQIIANTIDDGESVFLFSKEMPERMSTNWFNFILAGRRNLAEKVSNDGKKYHVVPFETKKKIQEYYRRKLYIYKDTEPNDRQEHNACHLDDVDWYLFQAIQGDHLLIGAIQKAGGAAMRMEIYDSDLTMLISTEATGFDRSAFLRWTVPADGLYYLKLNPIHPGIAGTDADYRVWQGQAQEFYLPVIAR